MVWVAGSVADAHDAGPAFGGWVTGSAADAHDAGPVLGSGYQEVRLILMMLALFLLLTARECG